jgi:hypothetical protein
MSAALRMVRALIDLDSSGGTYLTATLYDVARNMKLDTHSHMNTARVLSECYKVLERPRSTLVEDFLYAPETGTLRLHILDRSCLPHLRMNNKRRVKRVVTGIVKRVLARNEEGRFRVPFHGRSNLAVEVRRRVGGIRDGKLDWYLFLDGMTGKAIRSLVEIDVKI